MKLLKDRIITDGRVIEDKILKVDNFLNHQIDVALFNEIGKEFKRRFNDVDINKILTVESSGIGLACITAQYFNVPVVFAKKALSINLDNEVYQSNVFSFTKNTLYNVYVSQRYLKQDDNVLIIDDFLANGHAAIGLMDIIGQAGANTAGIGIAIEKKFQEGRKKILDRGVRLESLAVIESLSGGQIVFE